jgi:hypothetical protein
MRYYSGKPTDYRGTYRDNFSEVTDLFEDKGKSEETSGEEPVAEPDAAAEQNVIPEAVEAQEHAKTPETTTEDVGSTISGVAPETPTDQTGAIVPTDPDGVVDVEMGSIDSPAKDGDVEDEESEEPKDGDEAKGEGETDVKGEAFDPSEHSVTEVLAYIKEHPDEAEAVKAAEAEGKGRATIANA